MMIDSAKKVTYQTKVEEGYYNRTTHVLFGNYLNNFCTSKNGSAKDNRFEIKIYNKTISDDLDIANVLMIIL